MMTWVLIPVLEWLTGEIKKSYKVDITIEISVNTGGWILTWN